MFVDVTADNGIMFTYDNGTSPKLLMVESTGGGVGWFDLDQDGWLDLILPQGGIPDLPPDQRRTADAVYRKNPAGGFTNVTAETGLDDPRYGQGIAVADFDNDGFDDVLVTNVGRNTLYRNQGDGTFLDVTIDAGLTNELWSSSAAWGDIDLDGDLDLYVCNYTKYDPYHPIPCRDENGKPAICHPRNVPPEPDEFHLNNGDGTFRMCQEELGLFGEGNRGLGVVIADLTEDGWPDIYVANDTTANFFFVNEQGSHFTESAMRLGGAFSATGGAQASMGIAVGDYDHNGFLDLCLTHFTGEHFTLYQNLGAGGLSDVSALTGLREPTLPKLGFGALMHDFNNDGHQDLMFANGHIDPNHPDGDGYAMYPQVLSFDGRRWHDGTATAGDFFQQKHVGRGLAWADYDRDGDSDVVFVSQNSPTALLENRSLNPERGLRIALRGTRDNRDAVGTRVTVHCGSLRLYLELLSGMSFASAQESVLHFGLGRETGPVRCHVRWPDGEEQELTISDDTRELTVIQGQQFLTEFKM